MSRTKLWLCVLLFTLITLIPCSFVQATQDDDLTKMQGVWLTESSQMNGVLVSQDQRNRSKTIIAGTTATFIDLSKPKEFRIELRTQSQPQEIDLYRDGKRLSGIYELRDDKLKLCLPFAEDVSRPTRFQSDPDSGLILMVLKRSTESLPPALVAFLKDAKHAEGIKFYQERLVAQADDQQAIAALGLLQTAYAIEGLAQDYYRYGFSPQRFGMPGLIQIPVPTNSSPEAISYEGARNVFSKFLECLTAAENTLARFKPSQLKIPLDVSEILIDLDGHGNKQPLLPFMFQMTNNRMREQPAMVQSIVFSFDDADVVWLRGYVNLISAVVEIVLAHNWEEAFDRSAHLFFPRVQSEFSFLAKEKESSRDDQNASSWDWVNVVDIISLFHMMRFEVNEPARMLSALSHMESVIGLSRETWRLIRLETDNDQEFIPNSRQNSIVLNNQLGGTFGDHWEKVLDRAQSILEGKALLPYWRGFPGANGRTVNGNREFHPTLGINFRKIFTHPTRFDLVLWIQGTGLQPYLEEGKILDASAWESISRPFGGNLPFFALWFN